MSVVACNRCEKNIVLDATKIQVKKAGEIEVQYFACTHCRKTYQIMTTDKRMRELITQRKKVQRKLQFAHQKRFSEKTISKYIKELSQIKNEQTKIMPYLKKIGEEILVQKDQ